MHDIIKNSEVCVDDPWRLLTIDQLDSGEEVASFSIVPYEYWKEHKQKLLGHKTGIFIDSHEIPVFTVQELEQIPLIIINFPVFSDGRGFSIARILREKLGYAGEIRAYGQFIRDQLTYLKRCGFTSFQPGYSTDLNEMLKSINDFSDGYQSDSNGITAVYNR
ncbi:MAG: DUF934 domain-containing protein [Pseudomonadales bacterium]|nr:DUF934 domain-containing protein [Pseudomonadales bacterium]